MAKQQAFMQDKVALPVCRGCDQCGDFNANHLYILAYDNKHYCKVCFFKMAVNWPRPQQSAWIASPEKFRQRWEKGERFSEQIAQRLRDDGLEVHAPERTFRASYQDRVRYRDEIDLVVNGHRVEVKSRRHHWTSLDDFPYPSIFVDTVKKWDGHAIRPLATINVSQKTGAIIVVPGKSQGKWTKVLGKDRDSGHACEFYSAPRETWTTYEALVNFLKGTKK